MDFLLSLVCGAIVFGLSFGAMAAADWLFRRLLKWLSA
jgi:hypothetical protein